MPTSAAERLDQFLALLDSTLEVKRTAEGATVSGPEGSLDLRAVPGGYIELSALVGLYIGEWAYFDDPPESGSGTMHWWAELSDAAYAWEELGFALDQPGAFDVTDTQKWYYETIARKHVRVSKNGHRVLARALTLSKTMLVGGD